MRKLRMRNITGLVQDYTARWGQSQDSDLGPLTPELETKVEIFPMQVTEQNCISKARRKLWYRVRAS